MPFDPPSPQPSPAERHHIEREREAAARAHGYVPGADPAGAPHPVLAAPEPAAPEASGEPSTDPGAPAPETGPPVPGAGAEVRVGVLTTVGLAALGVPVAALWYLIAPRVVYQVARGGAASPVDFETKGFVADDGWFFVLTAVVGLACGTVAYLTGRRYGWGVALGLAAGGLAGAVVAWKLGTWFGSAGFHDAVRTDRAGTIVRGPLTLGAKGALVAWPVAALVAFVLGTAYGPSAGGLTGRSRR